jgi:hypothetical protein
MNHEFVMEDPGERSEGKDDVGSAYSEADTTETECLQHN